MKANASRDKYEVVAEINMIPFIDVALVLLIIFMVMTPILVREQIKINLSRTSHAHLPPDTNHKLIQISVTREGAIYVNGEATSAENVEKSVKGFLTDPDNQPVVIAADREVAFEKVVVVMDAVKNCGVSHLGVSVKHSTGAIESSDDTPRHTTTHTKPTKRNP